MLEDIVKGRVIPPRPGRAFAVASVTFVCRKAALTQPQIAILSEADFAEDARHSLVQHNTLLAAPRHRCSSDESYKGSCSSIYCCIRRCNQQNQHKESDHDKRGLGFHAADT